MNIKRFLSDIQYDLLIPPLGLDFYHMTPQQGKENFEWFMSKIPERMNYFRKRCAEDLHIPVDYFDYSGSSLISVWKWFLKTARIEKTPKRELEQMQKAAQLLGPSYVNKEQFSVSTQFILRDIGMYLGQAYVVHYRSLYWTFYTKPRNDINVNQPVLRNILCPFFKDII